MSIATDGSGLADAYAALATDDVPGAVALLTDAVATKDFPAAELLLGELPELRLDFASSRPHMEMAYRGYKRADDAHGAARAATSLGSHYYHAGNEPASRTWFTRAERLLDEVGPCPVRGYLELGVVGCWRPDAAGLERSARLALDLARQCDDIDLECQGRANLGFALVTQGHIEEGTEELDVLRRLGVRARAPTPLSSSVTV